MAIKILIPIILLVFISKTGIGQELAIIKDKDGYTNIRDGARSNAKIIGRIFEGDIFFCVADTNSDWSWVAYGGQLNEMEPSARDYYQNVFHYKTNSVDLSGYIHKSRLLPFSKMKRLNEKLIGDRQLMITNDSLLFQIRTRPFDSTRHRIVNTQGSVPLIDNRPSYGNFDRLPKLEIQNIKLVIEGTEVIIPTNEYNDLYEIDLSSMHLVTDDQGRIYIYSSNSDGAGGYDLVWVFKNRKYLRRFLFRP